MTAPATPPATLASLAEWFALATDASLAVDPSGHIVLANAPAERMFGYAAGALRGLELETLVPAPLREAHRAHRRRYLTAPRPRVIETNRELTGLRRDGTTFPIGVSLSPVMSATGLLVVASVRDISQTWRARQVHERERRDSFVMQIDRLALESSDYERAIERIPELIATALEVPTAVIFSTDWRHDEPRIRAATGLPDAAAGILTATFGKTRFIRTVFVPGGPDAVTRETLDDPRHAGIREGLAAAGFHDIAMVPLFGREEPLGAIAVLAPTAVALDRGRVGFLQSVANLLAAAVQRSRSEEQLAHAQRLDAVGQLTGGVAHDFNNLLTVISGNLQILEAELATDPAAKEIIDSALRAVDRGADLTRRLLAFARRQPLRPRPVVPKPLLDELAHMLRRTLGETIEVEVDCDPGVPDVFADANELDAALVNLALNARDAMPRGGRMRITARATRIAAAGNDWKLPPGHYVAFEIGDTGTGMPPEVQAHVLEPFFTTKGVGKGSGLGLSMVYGFVTQSGGALTIDSRLGYGTHVTFLLPVAGPGSERTNAAAPPHAADAVTHAAILVVEDEADVRTIAARFLRAIGYRVTTAASAREALEVLESAAQVDLMFSDIVLGGGMDGIELAHAARGVRPALPVLLTSGYEGTGTQEPGQPIEGFELLRKPYRREQLTGAVARALRQD